MAQLRTTKRVKQLAGVLRAECADLGLELLPGAAEDVLADKVEQIANRLGITPRHALDRYVSQESVTAMAQTIVGQALDLRQVMDDAPAATIGGREGLMVLAGFGMCAAVALRNLESGGSSVLGVIRDASDSVVHVAVTLATTGPDSAQVGGMTLAVGRKVLTTVIDSLRSGGWRCPCGQAHRDDGGCLLQDRLAVDLATLGGWASNSTER